MINNIIMIAVGLLSGVCASLGIGGGFVLLLYLTAVLNTPQLEAQLINLCFFLPVAVLSVTLHLKNKMIEKEVLLFTIIGGVFGVFFGVWISKILESEALSKVFAGFILIVGIRELFSKEKN